VGWKEERTATDGRGFYGVIAVSTFVGLVIQYSLITPGVVAVPLMVVIVTLVSRKSEWATLPPAGRS
jgi:hypothetical protein